MITLKTILRTNAVSCIIFGLLFLLNAENVAAYLGADSPAPNLVFVILGAVLVGNGLHLIWASFTEHPNTYLVLYFAFGDFSWVLASVVLVALNTWVTTQAGVIATLLVALMIGVFGVLQITTRKATAIAS